MITPELLAPKSIVVFGASDNMEKPGGKVIHNLLAGNFNGDLYAVNTKPLTLEGVTSFTSIDDLPPTDLAILSIPAAACLESIKALLARNTKAFIVFSAGFGEAGPDGKMHEAELIRLINENNACLIGPNCIGIINGTYKGVFTSPVPDYDPMGCELISGSGATAVFIMEAAHSTGLRFSNVYSIGNASQTGAEDILEYMDINFNPETSPKIKLLYLENIKNPFKFLRHSTSLINKGCRIAAIKSGYSEAGSRAASSHTGAMASTDAVVRALFQKAGVIYCSSRNDLISVGCVLQSQQLTGPRIAIITHAGGSAVMLTDMLSSRGLEVPHLPEDQVADLLKKLNPGSSVANPIDFLATGTAAQLGEIIDKCEQLPMIDAMVVVFGSPGLFNVRDVYQVIDDKMAHCKKPIYPVLPSLVNAKSEIELFLSKGHVNFPDEVELGVALTHVYQCPKPTFGLTYLAEMKDAEIRNIIYQSNNGYLSPAATRELLIAAGIDMVDEYYFNTEASLKARMAEIPRPAVMKVVGLVHKTEVKGITLNIYTDGQMLAEYQRIMAIPGARGVMLQPMVEGIELFCGAKREGNFGHLIICGLGGIFVEVLKDIATGLAPLSMDEALKMVRALKAYPIIEGYRNLPGASEKLFAEAVMRISSLVFLAPEIAELDINPLKGTGDRLTAVDARIRIEKGLN